MRIVAAAGRVGEEAVSSSRGRDGAAGGAAADAATGPPPRLLKSPPKVETLPAHLFSAVERSTIERLRHFFDSLEIVDEEPLAAAAEAPAGETGGPEAANAAELAEDDSCWHDVIEDNPAGEPATAAQALSRSSSLLATPASETHHGVETAAGDGATTGGPPAPPLSSDADVASTSSSAGGPAAHSTSSWFPWNFLRAGETPAADAASSLTEQREVSTGTAQSSGGPGVETQQGVAEKEKQQERQTLHKLTQLQQQEEQEQEGEEEEQRLKLYWDEALWLEDDLILARYLRSYGWNYEEARKQLLRTLLWRRQEKPHHLSPNQVASFARRGCVYRKGFDIYGRAVIYFKPGRDSSTGSHLFQRYVVYTIERAIESLDREGGVDQLVFIVDFSEWGIMQLPRTEVSREIVTILNDHYTDVLAVAFIVNAPSYFDPIWRLVSLMVHPDTAKKVIFVYNTKENSAQAQTKTGGHNGGKACSGSDSPAGQYTGSDSTQGEDSPLNVMRQLIPSPFLEECVGGESPLDYDHDIYWQAEKEQYLQQSIHRRLQRQAVQNAVRTRRRLQQQQRQQYQDTAAAAGILVPGRLVATPAAGL